MNAQTARMVLAWLSTHKGDAESLARWMRDTLSLGTIENCRKLIAEAQEVPHA